MQTKGPTIVKKDGVERWLYEALRRLQLNVDQTQSSISAIGRGESPDGSGNPLVNLNDYWYKPGISSRFTAYMQKNPGGSGSISSTASASKGFIYLGDDDGSGVTFDEANTRVGINEPSPAASLHITKETSTTTYLPYALGTNCTVTFGTIGFVGQDGWGMNNGAGGSSPYGTGWQEVALASPDETNDNACIVGDNTIAVNRHASFKLNGTISPGTWTVTVRAKRLFGLAVDGGLSITLVLSDATGIQIGNLNGSTLTDSWVDYEFTGNVANVTGGLFANEIDIRYISGGVGIGTPGYFAITKISVSPGSSSSGNNTPIQRWETVLGDSNDLDFALDGGSGLDLEITGDAPLRISSGGGTSGIRLSTLSTNGRVEVGTSAATNMNLVLSGTRATQGTLAISDFLNTRLTGTIEIRGGSPAVGRILTSTDSNGLATWSIGSALATRVQHRWVANGPYRVDTSVDGGIIPATGFTISAVWLHRTTAGTSGQTRLDLNKNGTTMYTTQANRPTILFSDGDNKVLATNPDVTTVAAGDILTIDIDEIEIGSPKHVSLIIEAA